MLITSVTRTPADQARIMFEQLSDPGHYGHISRYGRDGQQVIATYHQGVAQGLLPGQIQHQMENVVQGLFDRGHYVSNHMGDPNVMNVVDITPRSIPAGQSRAFEHSLDLAVRNHEIRVYHGPNRPGGVYDSVYHIEIPQPR